MLTMSYFGNSSSGSSILPPVIMNLMIANVMLFLLQAFFAPTSGIGMLEKHFALWPIGMHESLTSQGYGFFPWQVLTYGFLHGSFIHIFWNLFALWMFGREIELQWGSKRFLVYYLTCVIGAGLLQLIVATLAVQQGGRPYPTIGASGGTFGVLLAFGMMYPYRRILLLIPPIPIEARWFVIIYGAIELFLGVSGMRTGIAHFAHLGGMLFGLLLILYWRGKLPIQPKHKVYW